MLGFLSSVQVRNACKVRQSEAWEESGEKMYTEGETLICYEFLPDGRYTKEYFNKGLEEVAEFVCSSNKDKLICNSDDYAIASTLGVELDLCVSSFRKVFFDVLIEYKTRCGLLDKDEY